MITTKQTNSNLHEASFNENPIGHFVRDVDGYFYYSPSADGLWGEYELRLIADKLKEMNAEWDAEVAKVASEPFIWREDNL